MSYNSRRSYHGSTTTQPSILRTRKRKLSENGVEASKILKRDLSDGEMLCIMPLEDVTSASLNVNSKQRDRDRAITPEVLPEDWYRFKGLTCYPTPQTKRSVPLPKLSWADRDDVWKVMCEKDKKFRKDPNYISHHTTLQPRMRSILLDWITEVCEVYKMHRETYYLAVEYIDRYLSKSREMPKSQLQLAGITCLFIAGKIEEIYPPKISDYSFVTDGACTDQDILDKELCILKVLDWNITPVTINSWLNTYLQLMHDLLTDKYYDEQNSDKREQFIFPHYSGMTFVQVIRLLDLSILDIKCLNFTPSMIAATALGYLTTPQVAATVSGYTLEEMKCCYQWMNPFAQTVQEMQEVSIKPFSSVATDDLHNIQSHSVSLTHLDLAISKQESQDWDQSPPKISGFDILTPPKTGEKKEISDCEAPNKKLLTKYIG